MSLQQGLVDLAIVSLIAALTPILAGLLSRLRVPQVVILILAGDGRDRDRRNRRLGGGGLR